MSRNTHKALIVSSYVKFYKTIKPFVLKAGFADTLFASGIDDAKRIFMTSSDISAVIINTPLKDSFALDFALDTASKKCVGIMILVPHNLYEQVSEKTSPAGILTIMKPTSEVIVLQTLRLLKASSERIITYEEKNCELQDKMEEIKLLSRAKMLLIENLGMTEEQAHKYIEHRAMDSRLSKKTVSENIIKSYGS